MIRRLLFSCIMLGAAGTTALAHHTTPGQAHRMAEVRITERVLASGKPLPPGTYEVIVTDERPASESGVPIENQRWVEFVQNKQVIAREIAELFTAADRPVGTSGASGASAVVQRLRGDEFLRIAVTDGGARYLVHLPLGPASAQP